MAIKYDSNDTYYAYENGVLRNKYGIKNQSKLDKLEGPIVLARIATIELKTKLFDLKYICDINKYLFSDIYEWAGELRKVDISKGSTRFANFQHIIHSWNEYVQPKINGLKTSNNKIKTLAEIIGEMNIIHPFREGNGRSIRTFIQLLAKAQNIVIDWSKITEQENIDASIAYINGDIKPFILLLKKCKI